MSIKKRFIAGATCPECKETDTLRWWEENKVEWAECVSCDFKQQRVTEQQQQAASKQSIIGIFEP
ncbi:YheV family putative zinc ribbon protein [Vibrio gallicus]|uniref:YheV family putative zinc ribbon protein n=1 Tax=Vibrio gallicus TaxID=190897 RepID=UPI0021C28570|nr:YheV family putative zinc ribbon protein [Vibrio gallicus]